MKFNLKKACSLVLCGVLFVAILQSPLLAKAADAVPIVSIKTNVSNGVSQSYVIEGANISLDDIEIKYYYSKSDNKAQSFFCDNAGLNLNVAPYYTDLSKSVVGTFTSKGLTITFKNAGSLGTGRLNLGVRFNNSDWSAYTNFRDNGYEVYYKGKLVSSSSVVDPIPEQPVQPSEPEQPSQPEEPSTPVIPVIPSPTNSCILPACSIDQNGPFQVTVERGVGPSGKGWLVRPTNLGTNGMTKHPVFIWGPGGGDSPSLYEGFMKKWASMGFIVYSEESQWSGDQAPKALDWICNQNTNRNSVLFGKVDTTRMAAGGFSLGSVGAYKVAADPRIITTIHCDGGSFDGKGHLEWRHPTCVMNGLNDGGLAMNNTDRDYNAANVPIWYGGIIGGGHGSTVWDGNAAITAWLRWQVGGDETCKDMFLTPQGRFNNGIYKSRWKNWN